MTGSGSAQLPDMSLVDRLVRMQSRRRGLFAHDFAVQADRCRRMVADSLTRSAASESTLSLKLFCSADPARVKASHRLDRWSFACLGIGYIAVSILLVAFYR